MKENEKFWGLLKSIFYIVVSVALVLFGYCFSDGTYNIASLILVVLGVILFLIGMVIGISNLTSGTEVKK